MRQQYIVAMAMFSLCALPNVISALSSSCESGQFWDANRGMCSPCPRPPEESAVRTQQYLLYSYHCRRFSTCCVAAAVQIAGPPSEPPPELPPKAPPESPPEKPVSGRRSTPQPTETNSTVESSSSQPTLLLWILLLSVFVAVIVTAAVFLAYNYRNKLKHWCHKFSYQPAQTGDNDDQTGAANNSGADNREANSGQVIEDIVYDDDETRRGVYPSDDTISHHYETMA